MSIYLDNNATTRVADAAREAMLPFLVEDFANPSSPYAMAQRALAAVHCARGEVARLIAADPGEILFTSGGTESNNAVLTSVAAARPGARILISAVEHPAVTETAHILSKRCDARIGVVPVRDDGSIDANTYSSMLNDGWDLVSLMAANNETGVVFPIADLARMARDGGALFHTDAVQAAGKITVDVREAGVDFLSLAAHKLHGPKGVGALYIKEGTPFDPFLVGGGQERRRRAGTLNTPGIAGFGCAARLAHQSLPEMTSRVRDLRDRLEATLLEQVGGVRVNGGAAMRLPNTSSLAFEGVDAETLLARLDLAGVCCSAGSACMAGSPEPSPVLTAMGLPSEFARGSIRLSLSRLTTGADIDEVLRLLPAEIEALRAGRAGDA